MSAIDEMRARHKEEIEYLQQHCNHQYLSDWMEEQYAVGHSSFREVRICNDCGWFFKT